MRRAALTIIALTMPAGITACEGECIIGITKAFLSNYSIPIQAAFEYTVRTDMHANLCVITESTLYQAREIATEMIPGRYTAPPVFLMDPILDAYQKDAYDLLEYGIFPSYFHGKCQRLDPDNPGSPPINPVGCPNLLKAQVHRI